MVTFDRQTYKDRAMRPTPKITVRIDRGEDFAELCGDWQDDLPLLCGQGDLEEWMDWSKFNDAWRTLNEAVME